MGRPALPATQTAGGRSATAVTLREVYRDTLNACAQSTVVSGIEPLLLDEPVLKLRIHLGTVAFIDVFFNAETGKTSFALIKNGQRIFGVDNTRGWHLHPFDDPESHSPCEEIRFESFLNQVEKNKGRWI